jgi:citrate lyase subunit beta/citryl-CoA lyase
VILDLEDSVGPEAKDAARAAVDAAVRARRFGRREVVVRVNGLATPWGSDDLDAVARAEPDAILVPKVQTADDVSDVWMALAEIGVSNMAIWAMVETPLAVINAAAIAGAAGCLVIGLNDLAATLGARISLDRAGFVPHLATAVLAARAYGRTVLDGTFNDIRDNAGFREECEQGRDLGFDGKTLIHPDQIAVANAVFAPGEEEVAWARAVVAAFALPENAAKGVIAIEGKMAERLHEQAARRTLAIVEMIAATKR